MDREGWAQLKPNTPTGMLPLLEVDGKQIAGSSVIARFLAERFGLAGSNDLETAEIAGIIDVVHDCMLKVTPLFYMTDEETKAQMVKKLREEDVPKYWGVVERYFKKNNSADGWIYGDKPTSGDFGIYCSLEFVMKFVPDFLENHPGVAKMKASVEALPRIAKWLKERPVTTEN